MSRIIKLLSNDYNLIFFIGFLTIFHVNNYFPQILSLACILLLILWFFIKKDFKIREKRSKIFLLWYGLFTILVLFSMFYTVNQFNPDYVIKRVIVIFLLGFLTSQLVKDKNSFYFLSKGIIFGNIFISILAILNEGLLNFGAERLGTYTVGSAVNLSGLLLVGFICSLILFFDESKHKKRYIIICIFFFFIDILTGSRRSVILCIFFLISFVLINPNIKKSRRLQYLIISIITIVIVFYLIMTNDDLYRIIGKRFDSIINSIKGIGTDASFDERSLMKNVAKMLFYAKPFFGWGAHGFAAIFYLKHGMLLYSHCGFLEILSCYGFLGFILYYSVFAYVFILFCKNIHKKKSFMVRSLLLYFFITFIMDLFTISFLTPQVIVMFVASINVLLFEFKVR